VLRENKLGTHPATRSLWCKTAHMEGTACNSAKSPPSPLTTTENPGTSHRHPERRISVEKYNNNKKQSLTTNTKSNQTETPNTCLVQFNT